VEQLKFLHAKLCSHVLDKKKVSCWSERDCAGGGEKWWSERDCAGGEQSVVLWRGVLY
jgi:hypothetical protein